MCFSSNRPHLHQTHSKRLHWEVDATCMSLKCNCSEVCDACAWSQTSCFNRINIFALPLKNYLSFFIIMYHDLFTHFPYDSRSTLRHTNNWLRESLWISRKDTGCFTTLHAYELVQEIRPDHDCSTHIEQSAN